MKSERLIKEVIRVLKEKKKNTENPSFRRETEFTIQILEWVLR